MIVRLREVNGQTLGEARTKDELLALVEREAPPATVVEAREAESGEVIDLAGLDFEGTGVRNVIVEYVPAHQQLERLRDDVCSYIERLVDSATRMAFALRAGRPISDTELVPLLDGIDWVSRVSALAAELAVLAGVRGNGVTDLLGESTSTKLSISLEKLHSALECRDLLGVADVLDFDLVGWLEAVRSRWLSVGCEG